MSRKNSRNGGRRRRAQTDRDQVVWGLNEYLRKWGRNFLLTFVFAFAIVMICFVGQEPPGLRTLGEVAPENVYSDKSFSYFSEVRRKEAEEWIRSSTPREFSRNFAGEENFANQVGRVVCERENLLCPGGRGR